MERKSAFLTEEIKIKNKGHILYVYHNEENYVNNAVSYIMTGILNGHHVLVIDNQEMLSKIQKNLIHLLNKSQMKLVHFEDNYEHYNKNKHFHIEQIKQNFKHLLEPIIKQNLLVRTWAHVEWIQEKDHTPNLEEFEKCADQEVNKYGLISVCAYNGQELTASLQTKMMESHEYLMTDHALVRSNLYKGNNVIFPSLSEQAEIDKKKEKQLAAKSEQLQSFMKQNLDSVMIVGQNEKVIYINDIFEQTFGWTADEIIGLNVYELPVSPTADKTVMTQNVQQIKEHNSIYKTECTRQTKFGKSLNVLQTCFPFKDEDGHVFAWAIILRDQTERYQVQELLLQSDKLSIAGELAAGIAHEIRNPVTAIKGFLQLLYADGKNVQTYYSVMASEIERIELILSELLVLAKPQLKNYKSNNIIGIINDVITLLDAQANMKGVQIKVDYDQNDIAVKCDQNQIKQICINFIKNGIEAMDSGGILTIKVQKANAEMIITFKDEGKGIPDSILAKIGQPFFTTKENGTGLGLMVSKKIIEDHQGTIHIHSKVNQGTVIEVRLPLHDWKQ